MSEAAAIQEESLTIRLRHVLAPAHAGLEARMDLPGRIKTLPDYAACLRLFHGIFAPLEAALATHPHWAAWGVNFDERRRAPSLRADLRALGHHEPDVEPLNPPGFTNFSDAFGALYVLEGSTLGGKFILAAINRILGDRVAGATRFFSGHGARSGLLWRDFKAALDAYGDAHPEHGDAVISGAARCYALFAAAAAEHLP